MKNLDSRIDNFLRGAKLAFVAIIILLASAGLEKDPGLVYAASPDISAVCKTDWMYRGMIGLATTYFPLSISDKEEVATAFQVETVARQAEEAGASWFLLTLHHQNWIMMAPNATFDRIMGNENYTSKRDVPLEFQRQLESKGIKMMLYVNLRFDPHSAMSDEVRQAMGGWPPNDELVHNIAAVYREFSIRYGNRVSGWWIDGEQLVSNWGKSPQRERWFKEIADALRAGNPKVLIAFNPGIMIERYSMVEDYTAGERQDLQLLPYDRWVDGDQWHMRTFLGGWWNSNGTRFSDQELGEYVSQVTSKGGALTFSVGTYGILKQGQFGKAEHLAEKGYIDPEQVSQLKRVKKYRRTITPPLPIDCPN